MPPDTPSEILLVPVSELTPIVRNALGDSSAEVGWGRGRVGDTPRGLRGTGNHTGDVASAATSHALTAFRFGAAT